MPEPTEASQPSTTTVPWAGLITVLLTLGYLVGSIGFAGEKIPLIWRYQGEWHKLVKQFTEGGFRRNSNPASISVECRTPNCSMISKR
ncbi:MAG: hypothetical protein ACPGVU_10425 [Limisphaerales bacterium]